MRPLGKKKSGAVVGLVNTGNSCFINCVLQALASCHTFYYWLDMEDCAINDRRTRKLRPVTKTLMEIMKILNDMCSTVSDDQTLIPTIPATWSPV